MKKIFAVLLIFAATVNVFGAYTYTAKATLTLDSKGGDQCIMTIAQSDDATISKLSAHMNMDYRQIAFYAISGGDKYEIFANTDLATLAFGLMTNAETDYTLTATNVVGTLYIYDEVDKKYFTLTEGAVYTFTATANETNTTRFHLAAAPAPAVPGICHQNGRLEFTAYEGASVQVVGYEDNTVVAVPATDITLAYQEIDLATLAAGQYLVIVTKADQTEEKLVIKK